MTAANGHFALADFQHKAVQGLQSAIMKVAAYHASNPGHRKEVSLKSGTMLLQSPTGSGKTLILGRTLEGLRGQLSGPVVWFWFSPYTGLVAQTREALSEQCSALRLRDIETDRETISIRDGDVFVQTWASVAARDKEARRVRRTSESILSLDDMISDLRASGALIGAVIDEAHLNFGASAAAAADFYLNVIQPDFTLLATATPNDEKLEAFESTAGIEVASRIIIGRQEVVDAGLNKAGLMLGVIRYNDNDQDLIDIEQATLTAAWTQHIRIRQQLDSLELTVSPLMLVQVEDQSSDNEDPVARVKSKLIEIGVPADFIAVHTSGEPDPDFHTLAYDPSKQVLIFKVAVATGFDAPRAWTLVSVRPNRGREFGLQIVGRIMRIHPQIRQKHIDNPILNRGYVFLTDTEMQSGLNAAVSELKAVRRSIDLITDRLDIIEFGNASASLGLGTQQELQSQGSSLPKNHEERQSRLNILISTGLVPPSVRNFPAERQDQAILHGEAIQNLNSTPLFGDLPLTETNSDQKPRDTNSFKTYPLLTSLGIPGSLMREMPPRPDEAEGLIDDIAVEFCNSSKTVALLQKKLTKAQLTLRELFLSSAEETVELRLRLSNARVAQKAQIAFDFNDSIDARKLKLALVGALRKVVDEDGIEADERDLRRAIDLAVMAEPGRLRESMRTAQAKRVQLSNSEAIPSALIGPEGLTPAQKSGYGVFPPRMNNEELSFAELLDADVSGTVKWWLRNPENERWAVRLILPSGKNFFPDFVVGVSGRTTSDGIALVEIKDDGETGRLQSDRNLDKIRVQHREYKNVFWTYRSDGKWVRAHYSDGLHRIIPKDKFKISEMVYLS